MFLFGMTRNYVQSFDSIALIGINTPVTFLGKRYLVELESGPLQGSQAYLEAEPVGGTSTVLSDVGCVWLAVRGRVRPEGRLLEEVSGIQERELIDQRLPSIQSRFDVREERRQLPFSRDRLSTNSEGGDAGHGHFVHRSQLPRTTATPSPYKILGPLHSPRPHPSPEHSSLLPLP